MSDFAAFSVCGVCRELRPNNGTLDLAKAQCVTCGYALALVQINDAGLLLELPPGGVGLTLADGADDSQAKVFGAPDEEFPAVYEWAAVYLAAWADEFVTDAPGGEG